ncbi:MAG: GSCFA domain-containing protein [Prevotella sp.]|nr:GSCFA domain-containing protein [Prevotella sp.]
MQFRTIVDIPKPGFTIEPLQKLLFVGSCFADNIGKRFQQEHFPVTVNPFGVMYNPVSVMHTISRVDEIPDCVFITLGTNHVYRLKETGEIVDNCQKRPQNLFAEEQLTMEECLSVLSQAVDMMTERNRGVQVVVTVSPIRYAKYGFHGSRLSKATLLLAASRLEQERSNVTYFPAYEIVLDELRDYRFYQPDMIHPSQQAVEYIWERLVELYLSDRARQFLKDWKPVKDALNHRPFNPDSEEYRIFLERTKEREQELLARYSRGLI